MQRNWIGRSEGAEVYFDVLDPQSDEVARQLPVFTTRPDTLFGATFMAIAPQHPLVDPAEGSYLVPSDWPDGTPERWKGGGDPIREAIAQYIDQIAVSTADETKEKTGIFSGIYARNPVNGQKIPIFVADYVSMDYGAGAIMAVPAHDERDFAFATAYNLDIVKVVAGEEGVIEGWYAGEGTAINSPPVVEVDGGDNPYAITGLATAAAKAQIVAALVCRGPRSSRGKLQTARLDFRSAALLGRTLSTGHASRWIFGLGNTSGGTAGPRGFQTGDLR